MMPCLGLDLVTAGARFYTPIRTTNFVTDIRDISILLGLNFSCGLVQVQGGVEQFQRANLLTSVGTDSLLLCWSSV